MSNQVELIKEISGVNPLKCMKCGKCSASCPSYNEMDIKPHQFVSYVQNGDVEALVNSKSITKCLSSCWGVSSSSRAGISSGDRWLCPLWRITS